MNKLLTIVFNSYFSKHSLEKVLKNLRKYKIIVIENSLDVNLKLKLEKKYKNVSVVIPKENLGTSKGFNLGVKLAKTKYVFINNPDIKINNQSIARLVFCAEKIEKCTLIAPSYDTERIHKNHSNFAEKIIGNKLLGEKFNILSVMWIDCNFLINKKLLNKNFFDENYFLYFETIDFCLNLRRKRKNLLVSKNIKFKHYGSKSTSAKYKDIVILSRAWHYNWSKFYFYKKNYNYIYALTKIFPNFLRALKKVVINSFRLNGFNVFVGIIEIYGIFSSVFCLKSFYRPARTNKKI